MKNYQNFERYKNVIYKVYNSDQDEPITYFYTLTGLSIYLNITDISTISHIGSMGDCGICESGNVTVHKLVFDFD